MLDNTIISSFEKAIIAYNNEMNNTFSREKSWNLCYETFYRFRRIGRINEEEKRIATVELASYLASFGMYRNSVLLNMNYMGLFELMPILFDEKYYCLDTEVGDTFDFCNHVLSLGKDLFEGLSHLTLVSWGFPTKGILTRN